MLDVLPSLVNPSKKKSSEVTSEAGLQGKPLTDIEAFKFAMQKSCSGSGSAEKEGKGRSNNTKRHDSIWKGEVEGMIMAATGRTQGFLGYRSKGIMLGYFSG
ncbi:hypothetical protein F2P56_003592 [Juglans regia]|uniref:Uncharacterized protein n=1 Tax=Juglans regia TaxID=51240 RepID=A0A833Y593_JUGRE|nr:hypothetical protein F2P56_003592 [Juglans regia]